MQNINNAINVINLKLQDKIFIKKKISSNLTKKIFTKPLIGYNLWLGILFSYTRFILKKYRED